MKTSYITIIMLASLLWICLSCKEDDNSSARNKLVECIQKAEASIAESVEANEEGCIAPGSKAVLQTRIDWAYFILQNSSTDEAYTNASTILNDAIDAFYANVVKAGIPLFGLGSKMNLGTVGEWDIEESFTIECRVKYNEFAGGDQNIISCENGNSGWMLRNSGNIVQFYINDGNWTGCQTSSLELNRWYHIAATYQKGKGIALYLDGQKVGSSSCGSLAINPTTDLQAGTAPSYADRYMRGYIQDLSLWKDVRTAEEVATDVNGDFTGTEDGLNAYWPLNLNLGTEVTDLTGNRIATLIDVTWESDKE